jgi:hypothetical protein
MVNFDRFSGVLQSRLLHQKLFIDLKDFDDGCIQVCKRLLDRVKYKHAIMGKLPITFDILKGSVLLFLGHSWEGDLFLTERRENFYATRVTIANVVTRLRSHQPFIASIRPRPRIPIYCWSSARSLRSGTYIYVTLETKLIHDASKYQHWDI